MSRSTTYVGERDGDGIGHVFIELYESGQLMRRFELPHIVKHSPTGMEWGFGGSGPSDLANSLLAHVIEVNGVASALYQQFKADVVSRLNQDGFRLTDAEVREWLNQRWSQMDEERIRADLQAA